MWNFAKNNNMSIFPISPRLRFNLVESCCEDFLVSLHGHEDGIYVLSLSEMVWVLSIFHREN